ncbi:hypothetical protein EDD86DRAFT_114983 [Gorgonomyces haynaldii]|nr:hypothetical protein EDD86DRAFT_114983 [Gorgonomyces haynaldii]
MFPASALPIECRQRILEYVDNKRDILSVSKAWSLAFAQALYATIDKAEALPTVLSGFHDYHLFVKKLEFSGMAADNVEMGDLEQVLKKTTQLESFSLQFCFHCTSSLLQFLADSCHQLKRLVLRGCPLSDTFLPQLTINCQSLEYVDISNTRMSSLALFYFISNCPAMKEVHMAQLTEQGDADVLDLVPKGITRPVTHLNLRSSPVTDNLLRFAIAHVPDLKELFLESCTLLTDYSIMKIANSCPKLSVLDLSFCDKVTDVSLQIISIRASAMNGGYLEELHLAACEQLTPLSIHQLVQKCTKLQLLVLDGCEKIVNSFVYDFATFKNNRITCSFEEVDLKRLAVYNKEEQLTPPASPPPKERQSLRLARAASINCNIEPTVEESSEFVEAFLQERADIIQEKRSSRITPPRTQQSPSKQDVQKLRRSVSTLNLKPKKLDVTAPSFSPVTKPPAEPKMSPSALRRSRVQPVNETSSWGQNPQVWTNPTQLTSQSSSWNQPPKNNFKSSFVDPWSPDNVKPEPPKRGLRKAQSQVFRQSAPISRPNRSANRMSLSSGWNKPKQDFTFSQENRGPFVTKFMVETPGAGHQLLTIHKVSCLILV